MDLREVVPEFFQANRGLVFAFRTEQSHYFPEHSYASVTGIRRSLEDGLEQSGETPLVRFPVYNELRQGIGCIQCHVPVRMGPLGGDARNIGSQALFEIIAMRFRGNDDGGVAGLEAGADEVRYPVDEVRVILVELNEMLGHRQALTASIDRLETGTGLFCFVSRGQAGK
jgi:hypothetical protein